MTKYIDEFARQTADKMAQSISDMTYAYDNTEVPSAHYKKILQSQIVELMTTDNTVQTLLLGAILNQLYALNKESEELFFKALICFDLGIKPDKINQQTLDRLDRACKTHLKDKYWLHDYIHVTYQ